MKLKVTLLVGLCWLLSLSIASADSPHFVKADASLSGTSLVVSFKEAGLGTNQQITEVASATATAVYQCWNNGGHHPQAGNKETVVADVSASGVFNSGKNGSVQGSLTIAAPGPGSFSCPSGQQLRLMSVDYTNIVLTDTTNNVSVALSL